MDNVMAELTCSVCLSTFNDPHQYPCGHSHCLGCIQEMRRSGDFLCPECRKECRAKRDIIKNYALANVIGVYRRPRPGSQPENPVDYAAVEQTRRVLYANSPVVVGLFLSGLAWVLGSMRALCGPVLVLVEQSLGLLRRCVRRSHIFLIQLLTRIFASFLDTLLSVHLSWTELMTAVLPIAALVSVYVLWRSADNGTQEVNLPGSAQEGGVSLSGVLFWELTVLLCLCLLLLLMRGMRLKRQRPWDYDERLRRNLIMIVLIVIPTVTLCYSSVVILLLYYILILPRLVVYLVILFCIWCLIIHVKWRSAQFSLDRWYLTFMTALCVLVLVEQCLYWLLGWCVWQTVDLPGSTDQEAQEGGVSLSTMFYWGVMILHCSCCVMVLTRWIYLMDKKEHIHLMDMFVSIVMLPILLCYSSFISLLLFLVIDVIYFVNVCAYLDYHERQPSQTID